MKRHSENAMAVAKFLESHRLIKRVHYPGLESSPSHERARRIFRNGTYGGMMSVDIKGGEKAVSSLYIAITAFMILNAVL